ncbi:MAG: hypothetical protein JF606_22285 [Burkholderiales bacterium]|nr:hypothetical protein [Burkholderiales bacterium]
MGVFLREFMSFGLAPVLFGRKPMYVAGAKTAGTMATMVASESHGRPLGSDFAVVEIPARQAHGQPMCAFIRKTNLAKTVANNRQAFAIPCDVGKSGESSTSYVPQRAWTGCVRMMSGWASLSDTVPRMPGGFPTSKLRGSTTR